MNKSILILASALLLSACGSDNPEAENSMKKATEHAKEAAKELGNAVSETTKDVQKKWAESNANRHDAPTEEDTSVPVQDADMAAIKEKYEEIKQVTVEKSEAGMEIVKEKYEEVKEIAIEKKKEWSK